MAKDTAHRGNASQFFAAGELCRRNYFAVVTMGNTPNTDILCSNEAGTKFAHVQIKTFISGHSKTCMVGKKAERFYGDNFFWILCGIPVPEIMQVQEVSGFQYYIIPSGIMAKNVLECYELWRTQPGKKGQAHDENNSVRAVALPPYTPKHHNLNGWDITPFLNNWLPIEDKLK